MELNFPAGSSPAPGANPLPKNIAQWHRLTGEALRAALAGRVPTVLPPLDLARGTAFQRLVWEGLRQISLGQVVSYRALAERVGNPQAVRAVGGACGANPIPVLIPCHRIVGADGRLCGFGGGLPWKQRLLEREHHEMNQGKLTLEG